jgi:hypothetical protein
MTLGFSEHARGLALAIHEGDIGFVRQQELNIKSVTEQPAAVRRSMRSRAEREGVSMVGQVHRNIEQIAGR